MMVFVGERERECVKINILVHGEYKLCVFWIKDVFLNRWIRKIDASEFEQQQA